MNERKFWDNDLGDTDPTAMAKRLLVPSIKQENITKTKTDVPPFSLQ